MKENLDRLLPVSEEGLYPIRTVSEITGVNAITLRAWERRYGLFKPQRTPKGHRLYSQDDISKIKQVLSLLNRGISIGRVKKALENNAIELVSKSKQKNALDSSAFNNDDVSHDQWKKHQNELIEIINLFDLKKLESFHHEVFSLYPIELISDKLILPVFKDLKNQAIQLPSVSGNYQYYSHFLKNRLGGLFLRSTLQNNGKKILLFGYGETNNDVEMLLFSMPLITHGYQITNFGSNTYFDALPLTLSRTGFDGLILFNGVITESENTAELNENIIAPIKTVAKDKNIAIFVTGELSKDQKKLYKHLGLHVLPHKTANQIIQIDKKLT